MKFIVMTALVVFSCSVLAQDKINETRDDAMRGAQKFEGKVKEELHKAVEGARKLVHKEEAKKEEEKKSDTK